MAMIYNHENKDPKVVFGCKCWECEREGKDNEFFAFEINKDTACPYCGTQDDFAYVPIGIMYPMEIKEVDGKYVTAKLSTNTGVNFKIYEDEE